MKWLITGGCGFIGRALISSLASTEKTDIRVFDDLSVGTREDLASVCKYRDIKGTDIVQGPSGVELFVGDIRDHEAATVAGTGCDVIVHLAANTGVAPSVENPRLDCNKNVIGVLNMLESSRENKISRFVFASSGAPIGETDPPIHEEKVPHPVSPYGASKLAGEAYCSAYSHCFDIDTVALRFGNVYGPLSGRKESVVAKFIKRALNGEVLEIYGDGSQTRDFVYVEDLIEAIVLSSTVSGIGGEIFQIASSKETTLNELADLLVKVLQAAGLNVPPVRLTQPRVGDVLRNFSDTTKAEEMLGWTAKTSLDEGLKKTVTALLADHKNPTMDETNHG